MRRRSLLRTAGAALGAATIAGCLGEEDTPSADAGGGSDDTPTTDYPSDGEPETDSGADDDTDDGTTPEPNEEPVGTATVGDRDSVAFPDNNRPHVVDVENASDAERTISVAAHRSETQVHELTETVPAGRYGRLILAIPGQYTLEVTVDGEGRGTVTVERSWFDCNSSITTVTVPESGDLDTVTESTMAACHGPTVADATVESGDGDCAGDEDDRAGVSLDGEAVRIDGSLVTATPCRRATLVDASVEDRTLTVVVEATATDGACVECVGAIPYDATVEMNYDHPDVVQVVHRGPRGERTVTQTAP